MYLCVGVCVCGETLKYYINLRESCGFISVGLPYPQRFLLEYHLRARYAYVVLVLLNNRDLSYLNVDVCSSICAYICMYSL